MGIISQITKMSRLHTNKAEGKASIDPYFLAVIGPFFAIASLSAFLFQYSSLCGALAAITLVALPFAWKYQMKGALTGSLLLFCGFFSLSAFLEESSFRMFWVLTFCLSFSMTLVLTAIASSNFKEKNKEYLEEEAKKEDERAKEFASKEKYLQQNLEQKEEESISLKKNIAFFETELISNKNLLVATKEEGDKYFMQAEYLSKRNEEIEHELAKLESREILLIQMGRKNQELQKKLNEERVDHYQKTVLLEQIKSASPEKVVEKVEDPEEAVKLKREKQELLDLYDKRFRDYQAQRDKLQGFFTMDRLSSFPKESGYEELYAHFKNTFLEESRKLQQLRTDIFKIEGQLLEEQGISQNASGNLVVADQECLRLEEENALLFELFSTTLSFLEEKRKVFKEELESHTHLL